MSCTRSVLILVVVDDTFRGAFLSKIQTINYLRLVFLPFLSFSLVINMPKANCQQVNQLPNQQPLSAIIFSQSLNQLPSPVLFVGLVGLERVANDLHPVVLFVVNIER